MKLYGSLTNRVEEGKNYTHRDIKVGDDITMYYWSDRTCYYITRVVDQKHIFVRKYRIIADKEKEGGIGHQNWLYFKTEKECNEYLKKFGDGYNGEVYESDEEEWVLRYGKWNRVYRKNGWTGEPLEKPKYEHLQPISFGVKDYYYDWEF